jgi:hypothetical protein
MPIHCQDADPLGVGGPKVRSKMKSSDNKQGKEPNSHVKGMEADQRIVGCAEQVRTHGETLIENQVSPFARGPEQERATQ